MHGQKNQHTNEKTKTIYAHKCRGYNEQMNLGTTIIILPYEKIWRVICPSVWLTLVLLILLQSTQTVLDEKPYMEQS